MASTAESTRSRETRTSGGDVKDDMSALRADMERLVQDVARIARQRVGDGVDSTAKLKETVDENLSEMTDRSRDYVRDNPLAACAAAAAAGFALALLLKR